jgi:hypothetical protein
MGDLILFKPRFHFRAMLLVLDINKGVGHLPVQRLLALSILVSLADSLVSSPWRVNYAVFTTKAT